MSTALTTLAADKATMRWREPYVSDGLNRKLHGPIPRGIVRGGNLVTSLSVLTVEIVPDPVTGDSVYTYANADGKQLTVREVGTTTLSLNTGGIPGTTVYIGLEVDYTTGADTEATWRAYSQAEIDADEKIVVVGKVVVPPLPAAPIPAVNVTLDRRRDAWQDKSVGMRDWRQIVEGGSVDLPVPGKAADRLFPYFLSSASGSTVVEHSDVYKRSGTHSFRFGGTDGACVLYPTSGDGTHSPYYPVKGGAKILYSFYVRADNFTPGTPQQIAFYFVDEPVFGAAGTPAIREFSASGTTGWVHITGVIEAPFDGWMVWVISSAVNAVNAGYLYVDDIRIWMETGQALEDEGQAYLMGINRQLIGSTLSLLPNTPPDDLETWANSTIRLINTSPADGSAVSAKMTVDPLNGVDLFDLTIEARTFFKGTAKFQPATGMAVNAESIDDDAVHAKTNDDTKYAVYGEGGKYSIYGYSDGTDRSVAPIGLYGYTEKPGAGLPSVAVGGYGEGGATTAQPGVGFAGTGGGPSARYGVFGGGGALWAPLPTVVGAGAVFWGHNAVEAQVAESMTAGAVGIGGPNTSGHGGHGIVGIGADSDYAGNNGGLFYGGTRPGGGKGHDGVKIFGGDAVGTDQDGGRGLYVEGGAGNGSGQNGLAVWGHYRSGPGGSGWGMRGTGRYGGAGGLFDNANAEWDRDAVWVNSGIRFYQGGGDPESQNPDRSRSMKNVLKAGNVVKAWAYLDCQDASGGPNILSGFNIESVQWLGGSDEEVGISWAQDFADIDQYAVVITPDTTLLGLAPYLAVPYFKLAGSVNIAVWDSRDAIGKITLRNSGVKLNIVAIGLQELDPYPSID